MKKIFNLESLFISILLLTFVAWFLVGVTKINQNQLKQKQRYEQMINKK